MFEWYWNDRILRFTRHIRRELDREEKTIDFLCEILENGESKLRSKRERKFEMHYAMGKHVWILSYVEHEDCIILVHLGKKRR